MRPFGRLLTSYTVNELGDSVGLVALALLVYAETGDALATTALYLSLNVAPALLAPALIARIDRVALRKALPLIYVAEAAVFALLAIVANDFSLALVVALGVVDGTLAVTGRALTRAGVASLLEPAGELRRGNGLINAGFAVASVGGAALGGVLVGTFGADVALLLDSASFLVIAVVIATTRGLPAMSSVTREALVHRLREGLRYVRRVPHVRLLLFGEAVALILFTTIVPIEVVYARDTLDTDEAGFGLLLASWGAGMVIGSLYFLVAERRSLWALIAASTMAIGAAYLGMAAADTLAVACALSVLGGAGNGIQWVAVVTALQQATPADLQARVVGLLESLNRLAPAIGFVLGGLLTVAFSPRAAFGAAGAGVFVLAAVGALVIWRRRDELTELPALSGVRRSEP